MSCANCNCPFFELQTDDGLFSSSDLNCVVTDAVKQVRFQAGATLFRQGQKSLNLYSVSSGLVKITRHTSDGREQVVGLSRTGKLLVGLHSIDNDIYEYTAVAATSVRACKIKHRALLRAVKDRADMALRLISALNAQLSHSRQLMEVMGHKNAPAKIASFLLLVAPQAPAETPAGNGNGNGHFQMPFSRNDMASLLGLSEETVCRHMAEFNRDGVIHAPRGRMEIQDWKRLNAIADGGRH